MIMILACVGLVGCASTSVTTTPPVQLGVYQTQGTAVSPPVYLTCGMHCPIVTQ
jgi:hypothetical protein